MEDKRKKNDELSFFEGPRSRWKELLFVLKVLFEFVKGFRIFHFLGPCVTFFGSARFGETHSAYNLARQLGDGLARQGFTVMTGGGSGLMEAANRGAKEAGGRSVGCNIVLPKEQNPNIYLDKWVSIDYFFVRKVLLSKYSYAFVVMPGGFGTMDEFFEAITLIQTNKIKHFPVVVIGKQYYEHLYAQLLKMKEMGAIDQSDMELFLFTDSIHEALSYIEKNAIVQFGLKKEEKLKPWKWLGEGKG